jgi:hypothetical protein
MNGNKVIVMMLSSDLYSSKFTLLFLNLLYYFLTMASSAISIHKVDFDEIKKHENVYLTNVGYKSCWYIK